MRKSRLTILAALCATVIAPTVAQSLHPSLPSDTIFIFYRPSEDTDSLGRTFIVIEGDTLHTSFIPDPFLHTGPLTEADYREVAADLGVETAAIKAIVEIETGRTRKGFHAEGKPIINFDLALFRRAAAVHLGGVQQRHAPVDPRPEGGQLLLKGVGAVAQIPGALADGPGGDAALGDEFHRKRLSFQSRWDDRSV